MNINSLLGLINIDFLNEAIRMACPIILAAIGEVFLERAGIINLGCEGMMIFGAFGGVLGSFLTGNPYLGCLIAILSGIISGVVFGFFTITLKSNQIIVGWAFNVLGYSLTSFLYRIIWGIQQSPVEVPGIQTFNIPFLSKIPIVGRLLFQNNPIIYFTYLVIILAWLIMYKTSIGLKVQAIGENPKAADSVGINVISWRYLCVILNGALCAIGGAELSLAEVNIFMDNMTAGRGFIALAAVILGRWNPLGATAAALLFGIGDALQMRLQVYSSQIPSDLLLVLPYIITLLAVVFIRSRSSKPPAALTIPFEREMK